MSICLEYLSLEAEMFASKVGPSILWHSHPVACGIDLQRCIREFMPSLVFSAVQTNSLKAILLSRKFHITKNWKPKKKLEY